MNESDFFAARRLQDAHDRIKTVHREYIHQFWISFTFSCSYAAVRSVARILKLELHQKLSAHNSALSSQTTPNLVKLVLPISQCLVPASLYRSANDETFCNRAFLGILTFRFHQWKVLSGSSSCFVHLVFCSFWNSCQFISRYGFISRDYHSLINFWKGPPMMRSIQLTAKLVSSSSINKRCRRVFHNEVQTLEQLFNTIMQGIQAYPLTSLRDQSNK